MTIFGQCINVLNYKASYLPAGVYLERGQLE